MMRFLLGLWLVGMGSSALATPARTGVNLRGAAYGRINPLGLLFESEASWRYALSPKAGEILETAHIDVGVALSLTPVHVGFGLVAEVEPAAFIAFKARALRLHYFGTFGSIYELGSVDADWSPGRLDAITDSGDAHTGDGYLVDAGTQLRLAVGMPGPVVLADLRYTWSRVDAQSAFYEPYSGLLLEPDDRYLGLWVVAGWRFSPWFLMGARWQLDVAAADDDPRHTLGLMAHWTLPNDIGDPTFTAFGVVGGYLDDPYRTGELYFAFGLAIELGVAGATSTAN